MSFNIRIIGERINPGFKSTKALFDNSDIPGIQALAVKQAEAGASWLNVNIGARAAGRAAGRWPRSSRRRCRRRRPRR